MLLLIASGCNKEEEIITLPEVETIEIGSITQYEAFAKAILISRGGDSSVTKGFIWSTEANRELTDNHVSYSVDSTGGHDFGVTMSGLAPGNTYYVRSYAKNRVGVSYGNELTFKTVQPDGTTGQVIDIDGNSYRTIILAGKEWTIQNLRVSKYHDGSPIKAKPDDTEWSTLQAGAYGVYPFEKTPNLGSDEEVLNAYGALYNWYAVNDERGLCPSGWEVPTDSDWKQLEIHLGMSIYEANDIGSRGEGIGTVLKDNRTAPQFTHPRWNAQGTGATNAVLFNALPGGYRQSKGTYGYVGYFGAYWTASEISSSQAWFRQLVYNSTQVIRDHDSKRVGFCVRCVKSTK